MKKKILTLLLATSLTVGTISSAVAVPDKTFVAEAAKKKKLPGIKKVHDAIKAAYSEKDFAVNVALTKDEIKDMYGIPSSWYTAASAEVPMISVNVDTLVIVKAKNSSTKKKIKKKLTEYRQSLINDTMQYPMNVLKIQASRVYEKGDYVFFIMLGFIDQDLQQTGTESEILDAFRAKNNKAVKAINALYK